MQEIIMSEEKAFPPCPSTLLFLPQEKKSSNFPYKLPPKSLSSKADTNQTSP